MTATPKPLDAEASSSSEEHSTNVDGSGKRDMWTNDWEFIMSCIALSIGLGNVWRFPFVAFENGGGAFLIPYLISLVLIGQPIYYLELLIGQFSSRSSIKVFDMVPAFRGWWNTFCVVCVLCLSCLCVFNIYYSISRITQINGNIADRLRCSIDINWHTFQMAPRIKRVTLNRLSTLLLSTRATFTTQIISILPK